MNKWEYAELTVPKGQHLAACQQVGQEGWELVAALPMMAQASIAVPGQRPVQQALLLLFKRPVPSQETVPANGFVAMAGAPDPWALTG